MSYKFNPFTGTLDVVDTSPPKKLEYTNEIITVLTNNFLILVDPILSGTSEINVQGTADLRVL
jgi:hypothetical protein